MLRPLLGAMSGMGRSASSCIDKICAALAAKKILKGKPVREGGGQQACNGCAGVYVCRGSRWLPDRALLLMHHNLRHPHEFTKAETPPPQCTTTAQTTTITISSSSKAPKEQAFCPFSVISPPCPAWPYLNNVILHKFHGHRLPHACLPLKNV